MDPRNVLDISMKALIRRSPTSFLRIAGMDVDAFDVRVEDSGIQIAELRADDVLIITDPSGKEYGVYLEYQLQPDSSELPTWFLKCAGLTRQLGMPVALLVLYLEKGDRSTFPDRYEVKIGPLTTGFWFTAIRLWELGDQIEGGEYPELAPLLVLCKDKPTAETIKREIELIRHSELPGDRQADLLALAVRIAGRRFDRDLLNILFREEMGIMQGSTFIDDWIAEGELRGERRGVKLGRLEEIQRVALELMPLRLGVLPKELQSRIQVESVEWIERLLKRAMQVESVTELDWENGI